jgi:hypothetical protein
MVETVSESLASAQIFGSGIEITKSRSTEKGFRLVDEFRAYGSAQLDP